MLDSGPPRIGLETPHLEVEGYVCLDRKHEKHCHFLSHQTSAPICIYCNNNNNVNAISHLFNRSKFMLAVNRCHGGDMDIDAADTVCTCMCV